MDNTGLAEELYNKSLEKNPWYHTGEPRPDWDNLDRMAKRWWIKQANRETQR